MKKLFIFVALIVIIVIGASFVIRGMSDSDTNSTGVVEVSEGGVTLSIPETWVIANSEYNSTVVAVADPNSKDSLGFSLINVNIEKISDVYSLSSEFESNYNKLSKNSDYNILYEGNVSVSGFDDAMEAGYITTINGQTKQHKAIWVQKDSDVYVILCTAPQNQFSTQESTFDYIVNSIKIS